MPGRGEDERERRGRRGEERKGRRGVFFIKLQSKLDWQVSSNQMPSEHRYLDPGESLSPSLSHTPGMVGGWNQAWRGHVFRGGASIRPILESPLDAKWVGLMMSEIWQKMIGWPTTQELGRLATLPFHQQLIGPSGRGRSQRSTNQTKV